MDPLNPSPDEIRRTGHEAVEIVAEYLGSIAERPIMPLTTSAELRAQLATPLPEEGEEMDSLLATFRDLILQGSRHNGHPRFFGYVASPGSAPAAIAELLVGALNTNVTAWRSSPAATEIERVVIDWLRQIVGLPTGAAGVLVSGGSMANLCGLAAARQAAAPTVRSAGVGAPIAVYASEEAHQSNWKAAGMLGIGEENVRAVRVDDAFRMDAGHLEELIGEDLAAGIKPACVIATAGTVNTGSIDPLADIAALAKRYGLWMHVDACYGGLAMLAPSARPLFSGIEQADSIALDPHKWLYGPIGCGCILYRDPATARAAFSHAAEYTRVLEGEGDEAFAFWDYGPELSRRFRAQAIWLTMRHAGTRALGEAIERNIACAHHLEQLVQQSSDFEMLAPTPLSIFNIRHNPQTPNPETLKPEALNAHNERLLLQLQRGGSSYLSNTKLRGAFSLRGCVLNHRTTLADMNRLLTDLRNAASNLADQPEGTG